MLRFVFGGLVYLYGVGPLDDAGYLDAEFRHVRILSNPRIPRRVRGMSYQR